MRDRRPRRFRDRCPCDIPARHGATSSVSLPGPQQGHGERRSRVDKSAVLTRAVELNDSAMNRVYIEFFKADPPARATLAVTTLPRPALAWRSKCTAVLERR